MLSLFSSAKPFCGEAAVHQWNALQSWTRLGPGVEILLFGNDEGSAEIAAELGLRHFPEVAKNDWGTPLLSDIFLQAQARAANDMVCYVNADIILFGDFLHCVRLVLEWSSKFVMVGRRWDFDLNDRIEFVEGWEAEVRKNCEREGALSDPTAVDFFVFPRGTLPSIPPFAIGRPAWDLWLIKEILELNVPLVDITNAAHVVHQNHGYKHVPQARGSRWYGPEGDANLIVASSNRKTFNPGFYSVLSSTHVIRDGEVRRTYWGEHFFWRLYVSSGRIVQAIQRCLRPFWKGTHLVRYALLEPRGRRAVWLTMILAFRRRSSIRRRMLRGQNIMKILRRGERVLVRRAEASRCGKTPHG